MAGGALRGEHFAAAGAVAGEGEHRAIGVDDVLAVGFGGCEDFGGKLSNPWG